MQFRLLFNISVIWFIIQAAWQRQPVWVEMSVCVCVCGGLRRWIHGNIVFVCVLNMDESSPGLVFDVDDSALFTAC